MFTITIDIDNIPDNLPISKDYIIVYFQNLFNNKFSIYFINFINLAFTIPYLSYILRFVDLSIFQINNMSINIILTKNGKEYYHFSILHLSLQIQSNSTSENVKIDIEINNNENEEHHYPLTLQFTENKTCNLIKLDKLKFSLTFPKTTSEITIIPSTIDINMDKIVLLYTPNEINIFYIIYDSMVFIYLYYNSCVYVVKIIHLK